MTEAHRGAAPDAARAGSGGLVADEVTVDDLDELYDLFEAHGWSDGLPIVPPTRSRVVRFVEASGRAPDEVLGVVPVTFSQLTVELLAINAVMAGCKPDHMPVLTACAKAITTKSFNLYALQATTHPAALLTVVSGPEAARLGINARTGVFGPGWRANATIGRALRLVLLNVGGGRPGIGDMATHGNPAKYTYCIAENEDECPWEPYRIAKGFELAQSVVTLAGVEGPQNINDHGSSTGESILFTIAGMMANGGSNQIYVAGADPFLFLGPEHAQQIAADGYDRSAVQRFLFEHARTPTSSVGSGHLNYLKTRHQAKPWYAELDLKSIDTTGIPVLRRPEDLNIIVTGGAGKHSAWAPGVEWQSLTRTIDSPAQP